MKLNKSEEIWKDIDGFEGLYEVSTKGRVRNKKTNRILGGGYDGAGYKYVNLKGKYYKIHRLVGFAFLDNPQKLPYINHKNERKDDNNVGNLEWCSASYNIRHSIYKCSCKIKQLTKDGNFIKVWNSLSQIERELGYDRSAIIRVCKGRQRYSHNFKWEYVDPSSQKIMNRSVIAYKGNDYVGEFTSAKKASEVLGLCHVSVHNCLKGHRATTHGYSFKYAE